LEESSDKVEHATYKNFCGEPYDDDVGEGEFNMSNTPHRTN